MKHSFFKFRPFVSCLATFSFIAMFITGAVLYITPPGRVANWTGWTFWALTKHQWSALHTCFCAVFTVTCLFHIWLNIRPLMNYFIGTAGSVKKLRLEWFLALLVCVVVFAGSLRPFVPFSTLLETGERITNSWDSSTQSPPIAHAELLTVRELAGQINVEPDMILKNLSDAGITASQDDTFGTIAETQGLTPNELYAIATGNHSPESSPGGSGGGFGQQTLRQFCASLGIDESAAIKALQEAGIRVAADQTIRQIADDNGIHPSQIRTILENQ